jgi:ATP-dependent Lhr-like helicase
LIEEALQWAKKKGWTPFEFQVKTWEHFFTGDSGMVNAPTGSGKTYSLLLPILLEQKYKGGSGITAIWISPIKALTREIATSAEAGITDLAMEAKVGLRTGDSSASERARQKKSPPHILITTPESLQLLLASKGYFSFFSSLRTIVVDEWHELLGTKRGVQVELAISRLKTIRPALRIWGISATIGNLEEAGRILTGRPSFTLVKASLEKKISVIPVLPTEKERFPWAGHLGIKLIKSVVPIIQAGKSTLLFTNTRAQCEIWYRALLEEAPDLAGWIAMHHGSLSSEIRDWVEESLHEGALKVVVCTSSLDLGVDFRPVETVIQIGSPKGIARFLQRAGRSGHQPGAISKIYFVPTHALELIEAAALRAAIVDGKMEQRIPYVRSFDVLIQYLVTLAVSEGFKSDELFQEIKSTFSFESITREEWGWVLDFITTGGSSLQAYDEYSKVSIDEAGVYRVESKKIAMRHRLSIGTIVSDAVLQVKYLTGGWLGSIEEWFISQLKPGDTFWFAGRPLTLVRVKEMTVLVKKGGSKKGKIPAWLGGNLSLSSNLSVELRKQMSRLATRTFEGVELEALNPILEVQTYRSAVPKDEELLIEYFQDKEGFHLLIYPFEGRYVNEGLASLVGYRIGQQQPISFSIAMNDYGFELLADISIDFDQMDIRQWLSKENLSRDLQSAVNATEMAKRKFRDIASIAGLVFKGYPGKPKRDKHLQSSAQLFFEVFSDYDSNHLLLLQAYEEVMIFQLQEERLRQALDRIAQQELKITFPSKATPFSFPIVVDRLRESMSSEKLEDRIRRMRLNLEKD